MIPPAPSRTEPATWLMVLIVVAATAASFYDVSNHVYDSPDAWSFFELSDTIGRDFYRQSSARSFEVDHPYSLAFPPLWPATIWAARQVHDFGVLTGVVMNAVMSVLLAIAMVALARRLDLPSWVGVASFLTVISARVFNIEMQAGRAIPAAVVLFVASLAALARPSRWTPLVAGLLMGLATLNRFDAAPVAVVIGLILLGVTYRQSRTWTKPLAAGVVYGVTFLVVISPWMAYCQQRFGKPLASDNARQLCRAVGGHVTDYFDTPPANDLRDNPAQWLAGLVKVKGRKVALAVIGGIKNSAIPLVFAALFVVGSYRGRPALPEAFRRFLVVGPILAVVSGLGSLLVGYGEGRYYNQAYAVLAVILNGLLAVWGTQWSSGRASAYLIVLFLFPLFRLADQMYVERRDGIAPPRRQVPLTPTPEMLAVRDAIHRDAAGQPHRVVITPANLAAAYGALTRESTSFLPNFDGGTFRHFARTWHITHVYDQDGELKKVDMTGVKLHPLGVPRLYRIEVLP